MKLLHHAYAFFITTALLVSFNDQTDVPYSTRHIPGAGLVQTSSSYLPQLDGKGMPENLAGKTKAISSDYIQAPFFWREKGINTTDRADMWQFTTTAFSNKPVRMEVEEVILVARLTYIGGHGGN